MHVTAVKCEICGILAPTIGDSMSPPPSWGTFRQSANPLQYAHYCSDACYKRKLVPDPLVTVRFRVSAVTEYNPEAKSGNALVALTPVQEPLRSHLPFWGDQVIASLTLYTNTPMARSYLGTGQELDVTFTPVVSS